MDAPVHETVSLARRDAKRLAMSGLYPATVTPFADDLSIDFPALRRHLDATAGTEGVRGLVVNAGLAELLQLTPEEQVRVIQLAVQLRRPGQLLVAGVEGRSADAVVTAGLAAKQAGADALLVFPPFDVRAYRRLLADVPSVLAFFSELDTRIDLPLIVFQYPPHSGSSYPLKVLLEVVRLPNVVAVKAASGITPAYIELWEALKDTVSVLVAVDSPPLLEMLLHGAHGALIGIGAIAPDRWVSLLRATQGGDKAAAEAVFDQVCRPLMASVFENQQPKRLTSEAAATKEALAQLGQIPSSRVRPPAVNVDDVVRAEIRESLFAAGLLPAG